MATTSRLRMQPHSDWERQKWYNIGNIHSRVINIILCSKGEKCVPVGMHEMCEKNYQFDPILYHVCSNAPGSVCGK